MKDAEVADATTVVETMAAASAEALAVVTAVYGLSL